MADYALYEYGVVIQRSTGTNIPDSPDNSDRAVYEAWLAAGNTPDPYVALVVPISSVTPRQARLALYAAGLLDQVQAAVDAAGGATKITWEYATQISRNDPLITSISSSLGLTDAAVDLLFRQADQIP